MVSVIPSPVVFDPINVPAPSHRIGHSSFTIGMLGRITQWKGQHVFIEAFARAFPSGPERAVVIGAPLFGEDQYAHAVRRQAADLGLDGRIDFMGFQEDVGRQMTRLDALVHASVIPEPFGQVVIEGMAHGLPVIASDAGGPSEVIEDGVTGLLYEPGNVDALARAMRRLAEDPSLRSRLGAAARIRAYDFAPGAIAEQISTVYKAVLQRRQNASELILS
jgi:glycosyltransferase involved in cell wall biosynthesis